MRALSRELNLTPGQIAAKTGLNIKTIRKWLDKPRYEPRSKGSQRCSKLDPYKDLIVSWLEKHPYTGMQIFQRLRSEHGYTGCRSILHDFIVTVRPVRHQAFLKLAFEPGDCLQIDWATHGLMRIGGENFVSRDQGSDRGRTPDVAPSAAEIHVWPRRCLISTGDSLMYRPTFCT